MPNERRTDHTLRKLVILGNHLCMWAGREAHTPEHIHELETLFATWDKAIIELREERKKIEHISL